MSSRDGDAAEMTPAERLELARRLFGAIERGDIEDVRACYSPDALIWHNFDDAEQSVEENVATLAWMVGRLSERRYELRRLEAIGDGVLSLHVLHGTGPSGPLRMHAAMVLTMAAGRVTRIEEFLDPAAAHALSR